MTSQGQRDTADRDWFEDLVHEGRDISREMSRLLENRRWEPRNEPFRGFGSPPGRFEPAAAQPVASGVASAPQSEA